MAGCSHLEAVGLANRAAGVVVAKRGTATVSPLELLSEGEIEARIIDRDELREARRTFEDRGQATRHCQRFLRLLHAGHLHILREARHQGDVLVVGLNSDASVRSYKGPSRPIIPEQQRADMLLAVRYVDYVHIFDEDVPMPFIEAAGPAVHVNGAEDRSGVHRSRNRAEGGRPAAHGGPLPGLSTTEIIQRVES